MYSLTRSKTRENSGELLVFNGSAGTLALSSSVSGVLTRSRTRENSGELLVFNGSAGTLALNSSVSGGTYQIQD